MPSPNPAARDGRGGPRREGDGDADVRGAGARGGRRLADRVLVSLLGLQRLAREARAAASHLFRLLLFVLILWLGGGASRRRINAAFTYAGLSTRRAASRSSSFRKPVTQSSSG